MIISVVMKRPEGKSIWNRLPRARLVKSVLGNLDGPKARERFLASCGYAAKSEGLVARLGIELERSLPLKVGAGPLAEFEQFFDSVSAVALAQIEAKQPTPKIDASAPASQVRLSAADARSLWPWHSGQRVLRMARAHLVGRDASLAMAVSSALGDFCRFNPPLMGPAWAGVGLVAVRSLNWLMALRMIGDPLRLGADRVVSVLMHLGLIAQVLAEDLAQGPPRVVPAAGLIFLAKCLPFMDQAEKWSQLGETSLNLALAAYGQAGPSPSTSQVGLDAHWAALCCWLLGKQWAQGGVQLGLARLIGLGRTVAAPWGSGQGWGNSRAPSVLSFDATVHDTFAPAANLAAVVLNEPDLRAGRKVDETLFWLIGPECGEWLRQLAGGATPATGSLVGAGMAWLAAEPGGRKVSIRVCAAPSRKEAEPWVARSLDLAIDLGGHPLLATPGPGEGGLLAEYLMSRAAHSVVRIDGREPSAGRVRVEGMESGEGHQFMALAFDGYASLEDPVHLRRRVHLDTNRSIITVVDQLTAKGQHGVEVMFHLPPGSRVEQSTGQGLNLLGAFGRVLMEPDRQCAVEVMEGQNDPPLGWRSDAVGRVAAAPVIRLHTRLVGSATLTTVLAPAG